jgi:hypothetical protein
LITWKATNAPASPTWRKGGRDGICFGVTVTGERLQCHVLQAPHGQDTGDPPTNHPECKSQMRTAALLQARQRPNHSRRWYPDMGLSMKVYIKKKKKKKEKIK